MGNPYGPKRIEYEKPPQTHGERGGEAGERSPNAPSYYQEGAHWSMRDSTLPISFSLLGLFLLELTVSLLVVFSEGWDALISRFLFMFDGDWAKTETVFILVLAFEILGVLVSGFFAGRAIYRKHRYGEGFLNSIRNKVYDPDEWRDKWK